MGFLDKARTAFENATHGIRSEVTDAASQPQDEKDVVAFIRTKVEESRNNPSRVAFEQQTLTNTAYLLGYDSIYFDSRARTFRPISGLGVYPQKNRVHANLILPNIQNRLARLLKNPPKYDVYPNTTSPDDKDAARLTLKVVNHVWDKERIDEKRIELGMWQQQAGHAWIKVYWDPLRGDILPNPNVEPVDGAEMPGEPENVEYEGDVGVDVCSPFEIFVDPLAKSQDEMQWLIHAKVRKLSYFKDHYPDRGGLVKEESAWLLSIQNLLKINNMTSRGISGSPTDPVMQGSAIELAYFEKPSKKYPKGRMIITANGIMLRYDDLPCGKIPYVKFDDVKVAGKFYSESLITHLRPIQDQYNRNLRRKAEYINKGLSLKLIAAKGHGLTQESLNDTTEVMEFNPVEGASPPKDLPSPQMPQYVFNEDANLKQQFAEISGISEVSKGQLPSASIPAQGMQMLVEADETRAGIVTTSNENSWALVGALIARYASKYYITKRFIKEAGEDGEYSYTEFSGEDLRESYDVRVVKGSTLPNSKVLKRQEILNLHQTGYLGDPNDPLLKQKVLNNLEYGDISEVWEDLRVDLQQITRTVEQIEAGMNPEFDIDDNHKLHFDYKNRLRKSEKFQTYTPEVQAIFMRDLRAHKLYADNPQLTITPPPMPPPGVGMPGPGMPPPPGVGAQPPGAGAPPFPIEPQLQVEPPPQQLPPINQTGLVNP